MKINILEAGKRLSELIRSVQAGEEVIIAKRGQPLVRLVAIDPAREDVQRKSEPKEAFPDWLETHPLPTHLRRSAREIDQTIQAERDGWT